MPLHVIPFNMPEPMEIPAHIAQQLRDMPPAEAVAKGMGLLMQIEAADIMLYESIDETGALQLQSVMGPSGPLPDLQAQLGQAEFYGTPPAEASGLAGKAIGQGQSLLVMGQLDAGEETPMPPQLAQHLVGDGGGDAGFLYVLRLTDSDDVVCGVMTLIRKAGEGPLNHEQPNITEGMRLLLSEIVSG